jgi:hypothetical protein
LSPPQLGPSPGVLRCRPPVLNDAADATALSSRHAVVSSDGTTTVALTVSDVELLLSNKEGAA